VSVNASLLCFTSVTMCFVINCPLCQLFACHCLAYVYFWV
jgi:hypothetical protein